MPPWSAIWPPARPIATKACNAELRIAHPGHGPAGTHSGICFPECDDFPGEASLPVGYLSRIIKTRRRSSDDHGLGTPGRPQAVGKASVRRPDRHATAGDGRAVEAVPYP